MSALSLILNTLNILEWIIIIDILLSWSYPIVNQEIKIPYVSDFLRGLYEKMRGVLPVQFGMFDLSPIVLLLLLKAIAWGSIQLFVGL